MAARNPGGAAQFGVAISNLSQDLLSTYLTPAGKIFAQSVIDAGNRGTGGSAPSAMNVTGNRSATTAKPSRGNVNAEQQFRVAQPGTGIPDAQIEAVLHEGRGETTAWGFQFVESADLLLKDGSEYSDMTVPPEDLDIEASKQSEPKKWHHWKQEGDQYFIQQTNGSWTKLNAVRVRPLPDGSSLNAQLSHMTAFSSGLGGGTVSSQRITFYPNGGFDRGSGFIGGTGTLQATGGFSSSAASVSDRNGTRSSASGTYSGPGSSVTANSQRSSGGDGSKSGTYRVSGYALELHDANGQVERILAFYPFEGKQDIYLGNATFSPPQRR
jgi:hypothetical protein